MRVEQSILTPAARMTRDMTTRKYFWSTRLVAMAPTGAARPEVMIRGMDREKSTSLLRIYTYEAVDAPKALSSRDEATAGVCPNPTRMNKGANISPPPRPAMESTKEARKIRGYIKKEISMNNIRKSGQGRLKKQADLFLPFFQGVTVGPVMDIIAPFFSLCQTAIF